MTIEQNPKSWLAEMLKTGRKKRWKSGNTDIFGKGFSLPYLNGSEREIADQAIAKLAQLTGERIPDDIPIFCSENIIVRKIDPNADNINQTPRVNVGLSDRFIQRLESQKLQRIFDPDASLDEKFSHGL